ncbi:hypothetical protein ATO13_17224 [Stappia sp. 22II-S9-Z10]|nr:hypothetical protein ATO13_17224 [Stappia sp. 22II-S9-Z10]
MEGERDENEVRKDFTRSERVAIGRAVEAVVGERRGRPKALNDAPSMFDGAQQNFAENPHHGAEFEKGRETRDIAAERAGFESRRSYSDAKTVVDEGAPELVQAVDAGEVSVSARTRFALMPLRKPGRRRSGRRVVRCCPPAEGISVTLMASPSTGSRRTRSC